MTTMPSIPVDMSDHKVVTNAQDPKPWSGIIRLVLDIQPIKLRVPKRMRERLSQYSSTFLNVTATVRKYRLGSFFNGADTAELHVSFQFELDHAMLAKYLATVELEHTAFGFDFRTTERSLRKFLDEEFEGSIGVFNNPYVSNLGRVFNLKFTATCEAQNPTIYQHDLGSSDDATVYCNIMNSQTSVLSREALLAVAKQVSDERVAMSDNSHFTRLGEIYEVYRKDLAKMDVECFRKEKDLFELGRTLHNVNIAKLDYEEILNEDFLMIPKTDYTLSAFGNNFEIYIEEETP